MSRIDLVNIKQGTKSSPRFSKGNTLPLVQRPFGMAAFVPQTDSRGGWFYHPDSHYLEGVRLTHQPSPWIYDYGTFLMTPQNGVIVDNLARAWSGYKPEEAVLSPTYMKLHFLKTRCDFELVPTERGAVCRLDFHAEKESYLSIFPVMGEYEYQIEPEKCRIVGSTTGHAQDIAEKFKMYFVLQFEAGDVNFEKTYLAGENGTEKTALHICLNRQKVEYKLSTSYISEELAMLSMEREIGARSFGKILEENEALWEERLGRINAGFDDPEMEKTFYTCLWRTFLFPHKCYEYDEEGRMVHYVPIDGSVKEGPRYTDNGFWDTYRTVYPLFTLIAEEDYAQMLEGFVGDYKECGWLPRWISIGEVGCMPSTLIDAVIAHAVVNGIGSRELWEDALEGMLKHANEKAPLPRFGRNGVEFYTEYGYVPREEYKESVNLTLDAAYGDWCIAVVAEVLGKKDLAEAYYKRSKNYVNLFDKETGFMRGKDKNGCMADNFDPVRWGGEYTEASAWQTTFAVPHDINGLAELMGGKDEICQKLDLLFDTHPYYSIEGYGREIHEMTEMAALDFGQCAINNQPSFHIPYIYACFGEEEKARYWVHRMAREAFSYKEDGFPGDDDNGTAAAWYIFACLGFYPFCPGSKEFVKIEGLAKEWDIPRKGMKKVCNDL